MKRGDRLIVTSGIVLGVGLGGFVDGIVLHQILQWHEMVSSVVPPVSVVAIKINMLYDGLFHAFTWMATVLGIFVLALAASAPRRHEIKRPFVGSLLIGWGMFNVVEGLIDHQLLGLHHVHPGQAQMAWDAGFLAMSVILVVLGTNIVARGIRVPQLQPATV